MKKKMKDKFDDFMFDVKYGTPKEKAKAVGKAALFTADVVTTVTGTGAAFKTAKTAGKLAKCGKGTKMVATFTMNAQKKNIAKAAGATAYHAARAAGRKTKDKKDEEKDK